MKTGTADVTSSTWEGALTGRLAVSRFRSPLNRLLSLPDRNADEFVFLSRPLRCGWALFSPQRNRLGSDQCPLPIP